jgi:hypothetical protein
LAGVPIDTANASAVAMTTFRSDISPLPLLAVLRIELPQCGPEP